MDISNEGLTTVFTLISAIATSGAAIATWCAVLTARTALNTWKEEHKRKAQWDVARRAMVLLSKIMSGFNSVNHPWISSGEINDAITRARTKGWDIPARNDNESAVYSAVYGMRYEQCLRGPMDEFSAIQFEVKIICDAAAVDEIWRKVEVLNSKFINYLNEKIRCNSPDYIVHEGMENYKNEIEIFFKETFPREKMEIESEVKDLLKPFMIL